MHDDQEPNSWKEQQQAMDGSGNNDKTQRAARFASYLVRHNLPAHGAASLIAKKLSITPATVSAWIKGSLPRDPVVLFQFCDQFDVCPYHWVSGVARPRAGVDATLLIAAEAELARGVEGYGVKLNARQSLVLLAGVYNDPKKGMERLEQLAQFLEASEE